MTNPPPDITVTRDDVLALPLEHQDDRPQPGSVPMVGRSWHLVRFAAEDVPGTEEARLVGRLVWVDLPVGVPLAERDTVTKVMAHPHACALTREGARAARAAFLWQTALASDAALGDIMIEVRSPIPSSTPAQVRDAIDRLIGRGGVKA